MKSKLSLSSLFLIGCSILLFCCSVYPYFQSGFFTDDCLNSQVKFKATRMGLGLLGFTQSINQEWMSGVGRFFPLGLLQTYSFYYLFPDLTPARLAHLFFVGSNLLLFALIFLRWAQADQIFLFLPLILSLFQARFGYDPISGYAPFMQFILFYGVGSIYFQWKYLSSQNSDQKKSVQNLFLVLSAFLFGCGLLTYEILLPFLLVLFVQPFLSKLTLRLRLLAALPHTLIATLFLAMVAYLRLKRTSSYEGTEFNFVYHDTFLAFRDQFFSAFPLSYFFSRSELNFEKIVKFGMRFPSLYFTMATGMALTYFSTSIKNKSKGTLCKKELILLALSLAFLPPLMIAVSARHQKGVSPGVGYLPVYLSYFGIATLLTLLISTVVQSRTLGRTYSWIQLFFRSFIILGIGTILGINHCTNLYVTEKMNSTSKYPRELLVNAYESGLASQLEPNSILLTPQNFQWNTEFLTPKLENKIKAVIPIETFTPALATRYQEHSFYFLDFKTFEIDSAQGWVFLSKIIPTQKEWLQTPVKSQIRFTNSHLFVNSDGLEIHHHKLSPLRIHLPCQSYLLSIRQREKKEYFIVQMPDFQCGLTFN